MTIEEMASKESFRWNPEKYLFALMKLEAMRVAFKQGFIAGYQYDREPLDAVSKYIISQPSVNLEIKAYPKYGPYDSLD